MIYVLWLLMFSFCGGLCFLAIGFLCGALQTSFCVLLASAFFVFALLTAEQIDELEQKNEWNNS